MIVNSTNVKMVWCNLQVSGKKNRSLIRVLDIFISSGILLVTMPLLILIFCILLRDSGRPFFVQRRLGINESEFRIIKFRTMITSTADKPTHLVSGLAVTAVGRILRRTKLDELPQLVNVLKGEMSLVGPRPCLPNQHDVITERRVRRVFEVLPGVTGLAQIKGVDMSTPVNLASLDSELIQNLDLNNYLKYLLLTAAGKGFGDKILH